MKLRYQWRCANYRSPDIILFLWNASHLAPSETLICWIKVIKMPAYALSGYNPYLVLHQFTLFRRALSRSAQHWSSFSGYMREIRSFRFMYPLLVYILMHMPQPSFVQRFSVGTISVFITRSLISLTNSLSLIRRCKIDLS